METSDPPEPFDPVRLSPGDEREIGRGIGTDLAHSLYEWCETRAIPMLRVAEDFRASEQQGTLQVVKLLRQFAAELELGLDEP